MPKITVSGSMESDDTDVTVRPDTSLPCPTVITLTPLGSLRIAWRKLSVALTVSTSRTLILVAVGTPEPEVKSVAAIFDFNDLHNSEQNSLAMTQRDVEWLRKIAMHASRTRYARKSYVSIRCIGTPNILSSRRRPCHEAR